MQGPLRLLLPVDATPDPTTPSPDAAAVTSLARTQARSMRVAALAFATCCVFVPADPPAPAIQPVQGTSSLSQSARAFAGASQTLTRLLWLPPQDTSGPLPTQPDTYVQPIAGTSALRTQPYSARIASLPWTGWAFDQPIPQAAQPDTSVQPVQGTSAITQTARAYVAAVRASQPLWFSPQDQSGPLAAQPDTYIQSVPGTGAVAATTRAYQTRALFASMGWFTPEDASAASAQPDTYVQPIAGTSALASANQALLARATGPVRLTWFTPEDASVIGTQPDTYVQPIPGTSSVRLLGQAQTARVVSTATLGWFTPEDVSAPLPTQPDTFIAPIVGTASLARSNRLNTPVQLALVTTGATSTAGTSGSPRRLLPVGLRIQVVSVTVRPTTFPVN